MYKCQILHRVHGTKLFDGVSMNRFETKPPLSFIHYIDLNMLYTVPVVLYMSTMSTPKGLVDIFYKSLYYCIIFSD